MLKKQKELAKRVKKQDDLITTYETAVSWYETNKKLLTNIGIAIAVLVAGGWFYINNNRTNNEKAANEFAKVFSYYDNGQYQIAIAGLPEKNVRGLLAIVNDYGSTKYGNIAQFYLANCYFNTGEFDKAMEAFDNANVDAPILETSRIAGIAACYEVKANFADAAKYFEKAGKANANDPNTAEYLSNAARNYARSGNKELAIELYKLIKKEHSSSAAARDAERYLDELRG
ncbi:MAG: tetratricopeptide repeat protein [Bacteriovoracaceae bacterium]|nr:tetratricopeptide repeat protein [Bacteroidota bacterium]